MISDGGDQSVLLQSANAAASGVACTTSLSSSSIQVLRSFWEEKIPVPKRVDLAHPAPALPFRSRPRPRVPAAAGVRAIYGGSGGCRARPLFLSTYATPPSLFLPMQGARGGLAAQDATPLLPRDLTCFRTGQRSLVTALASSSSPRRSLPASRRSCAPVYSGDLPSGSACSLNPA